MPDPFNPDIPPWKRKNPKAIKSRSDTYQKQMGFTGPDPLYRDSFPDLARKLCMLNKGITDSDLAKVFEVSTGTIARWKVEYIEFGDAIQEGKLICDGEVIEGLYQRAKGYNYEEKRYVKSPDDSGLTDSNSSSSRSADNMDSFHDSDSKDGLVLVQSTLKHLPPDPQAAMLWLKNRHPKLWRDRQELQVSTKDPKEELAEMLGLTVIQLEEKVLEAQRVLSRGQGVEREIESLEGKLEGSESMEDSTYISEKESDNG